MEKNEQYFAKEEISLVLDIQAEIIDGKIEKHREIKGKIITSSISKKRLSKEKNLINLRKKKEKNLRQISLKYTKKSFFLKRTTL